MGGWRLNNTYRSGSGEVRWDRFGDPDGEPVVLLHGTPFSSFIWRHIAHALARDHLVYVWDMPGYGASDKFEGQDVSLAAQDKVFADLLENWGLREPVVVAHDSGGAVALGAHLRRGVRYSRLALVDAVALPPWGSSFFQLVGEHVHVFQRLGPELHGALVREYMASASSRGLHPATLDALVEPWLDGRGQLAFYRQVAQRRADQRYTDEIQDRYDTIALPVMVCWGRRRHVDPRRPRPRARLPHPRCTPRDNPRGWPSRAGGQASRAHGGSCRLPPRGAFSLHEPVPGEQRLLAGSLRPPARPGRRRRPARAGRSTGPRRWPQVASYSQRATSTCDARTRSPSQLQAIVCAIVQARARSRSSPSSEHSRSRR